MSVNGPAPILISSAPPSYAEPPGPGSRSKLFGKDNCACPAGIAMIGEVRSLSPTLAASGANTELGTVSRVLVWVTQVDPAPVKDVVQPDGNAGAVTPSKFCENTCDPALSG